MSKKIEALETAMKQIEKQFGKGSIMKLGENFAMNVEVVSTGCISLDLALGVGGLPEAELLKYLALSHQGKLR